MIVLTRFIYVFNSAFPKMFTDMFTFSKTVKKAQFLPILLIIKNIQNEKSEIQQDLEVNLNFIGLV